MDLNKMIKVLNLYAGIGGNRKLWPNDKIEVTAIENNPQIAKIYQDFFPNDKVIVTDAHQYLLEHYKEYDFIWSSPPCPTHSRMRLNHRYKVYPDMSLYQEIIFLRSYFKGKYIVENVIPYYEPLMPFTKMLQRHLFWANFGILDFYIPYDNVCKATKEDLSKEKDIVLPKSAINKRLLLRNCVNPKLGLHIFNCAFKEKQEVLI